MATFLKQDFVWTADAIVGLLNTQLDSSNDANVRSFCEFATQIKNSSKDEPQRYILFSSIMYGFLKTGNEHGVLLYVIKSVLNKNQKDLFARFHLGHMHTQLFTDLTVPKDDHSCDQEFFATFQEQINSDTRTEIKERFREIIKRYAMSEKGQIHSIGKCCSAHQEILELLANYPLLLEKCSIVFVNFYEKAVIKIRLKQNEVCTEEVLMPKIGDYGLPIESILDDITKEYQPWKGTKVTIHLSIKQQDVSIDIIPTTASMLIKALNGPHRRPGEQHTGDISLDSVITIARETLHQSNTTSVTERVKHILGTVKSIGSLVSVDGSSPQEITDKIKAGLISIE